MILEDEQIKNRKIIVFGAGSIARTTIMTLKELYGLNNINILGCAVTKLKTNVQEVEGVKVFSYKELFRKNKDAFVLIAVKDEFVEDVLQSIKQEGILDYVRVSYQECITVLQKRLYDIDRDRIKLFDIEENKNGLSDEEFLLFLCGQLKQNTISFEVNLVDHCNLNCQCCNHFSPLVQEKYLNIEQYKKDLLRIVELYGENIGRVMLLGGEPLLNEDIIKILHISRKIIKNSAIYLCTNGLLFPKMSDEFWNTCKALNIGIKVTQYPINFDYLKWEKHAEKYGIDMINENTEPIKTTYRLPIKDEGKLNPYKNYMKCYHANRCVVLRDGRLYTCPIGALIHHYNAYFGKNLPQKEENSIDIYQVESSSEIDEFLKKPISMCKHCDIYNYQYNIPWKTSKRDMYEWHE